MIVSEASSLREAADQMVNAGVGRLPVMSGEGQKTLVGILTRSDVLGAHRVRLAGSVRQSATLPIARRGSLRKKPA